MAKVNECDFPKNDWKVWHIVSVDYPLDDGFKDSFLNEVAGKGSCSSGCFVVSKPPVRDIQWRFNSQQEADLVANKMRQLDFVSSVKVYEE